MAAIIIVLVFIRIMSTLDIYNRTKSKGAALFAFLLPVIAYLGIIFSRNRNKYKYQNVLINFMNQVDSTDDFQVKMEKNINKT